MSSKVWAILEVMGHKRFAGEVSRDDTFGGALVRIDVPQTPSSTAFTKFFGVGSLFGLTPVSEAVARAEAARIAATPVETWVMIELQPLLQGGDVLLHPAGTFPRDSDSSSGWDDDEDYIGLDIPRWPGVGSEEPVRDEQDTQPLTYTSPEKQAAMDWAKSLLYGPAPVVFLDTETTGLDLVYDQPVEIAVIDWDGKVLFNSRVKPTIPVEREASQIHGISDANLESAPDFLSILPALIDAVRGKRLVIYNAEFDTNMLANALVAAGIREGFEEHAGVASTHCAMNWYAQYYGEWNEYRGNYKWQKLVVACQREGIEAEQVHSALGDAQMTRLLVKKMAAF